MSRSAYINGPQFFLWIPSLLRKSSSIKGMPSHNFTFGSHPSNPFAFVMPGFLWRGSSSVFSTEMIFTFGLIICEKTNQTHKYFLLDYVNRCILKLLNWKTKTIYMHIGLESSTSFTVSASSSIVNSPDSKNSTQLCFGSLTALKAEVKSSQNTLKN